MSEYYVPVCSEVEPTPNRWVIFDENGEPIISFYYGDWAFEIYYRWGMPGGGVFETRRH